MKSITARFRQWINEPITPEVLAIFRIGYGLFMAYEMIHYLVIRLVPNMFALPAINFKYDFFYWIQPLPAPFMDGLIWLLLVAALCIAVGYLFRWACWIFGAGYLFLLLQDKSLFNNHIYLFILLAFLLSVTAADAAYSIKSWRSSTRIHIPRWQIFILQAQVVIVYFYGGIAKLTYDWLIRCEPVRSLVRYVSDQNILSAIVKNDGGEFLLNYGGLALDLLSPLLLWYKPIRNWGVTALICFHSMNSILFSDIGIFPFLMLFSLILFYESKEIPVLRKFVLDKPGNRSRLVIEKRVFGSKRLTGALVGYFIFQLLFPLRGHFLPNQLDWTTIGNRFSWRMKVDSREIEKMDFIVVDSLTSQVHPVNVVTLINPAQILNLVADPRSVRDFSLMLKARAKENGIPNAAVFADIRLRYNGRPAQPFINRDIDLTTTAYSAMRKLDWVIPLNRDTH